MKHRLLVALSIAIALSALFLEPPGTDGALPTPALRSVHGVLILVVALDIFAGFRASQYPVVFFRRHRVDVAVLAILLLYFAGDLVFGYAATLPSGSRIVVLVVLVRSGYYALRSFARMRRLVDFLLGMTAHPAQTIVTSFFVTIVVGTALLMMPFAHAELHQLGFLDALFTATSAVCVTGLIVVDTATAFSVWGQLVILILIQVGGLGIIILSYFALFVLRRAVGVEDKLLLAYTLSEEDMTRITRNIKAIVLTTFSVETVGSLLLFAPMREETSGFASAVFHSVFHSVSAFCNAGFSLFSDSLEGFVDHIGVNFVVASLIIVGGLSFVVISNLLRIAGAMPGGGRNVSGRRLLSVNTKIVLATSAILVTLAFFGLYGLEHGAGLAGYRLGPQYLASFFQAVTLRTAGFNTVPIASLREATLVFMMVFMFIGGASGSTAGGIKTNTVAVHFFLVRSRLANRKGVVAFGHSVSEEIVTRSVLILLFGIGACTLFGFILSVTEAAPLSVILFETVSAFGTVGLSAGLTPSLSTIGRVAVILLMFMGRLGPLTILAAASGRRRGASIEYPAANVSVG